MLTFYNYFNLTYFRNLREAYYSNDTCNERLWWWADAAYKLMGVAIFVAATAELSFFGGYLTPLGALYWWSSLFIAIVLFFGLWCTIEKSIFLRRCLGAGETATDRDALLKTRNIGSNAFYGGKADENNAHLLMTTMATTYFSSVNINAKNNLPPGYNYTANGSIAGSSTVAHITAGPKLVNIKPYLLGASKQQLKSASKVKKMKTAITTLKNSKESKGGSLKSSKTRKSNIKGQNASRAKIKVQGSLKKSIKSKTTLPSHPSKQSSKFLKKGKSSATFGSQKLMKSSPKKFKKGGSKKEQVPSPQK